MSEEEYYQISEETSARLEKARGEVVQEGDLTVKMVIFQKGWKRGVAESALNKMVEDGDYEKIKRPGSKGYIYRPIADTRKV